MRLQRFAPSGSRFAIHALQKPADGQGHQLHQRGERRAGSHRGLGQPAFFHDERRALRRRDGNVVRQSAGRGSRWRCLPPRQHVGHGASRRRSVRGRRRPGLQVFHRAFGQRRCAGGDADARAVSRLGSRSDRLGTLGLRAFTGQRPVGGIQDRHRCGRCLRHSKRRPRSGSAGGHPISLAVPADPAAAAALGAGDRARDARKACGCRH